MGIDAEIERIKAELRETHDELMVEDQTQEGVTAQLIRTEFDAIWQVIDLIAARSI
jgi:hypothetical protein